MAASRARRRAGLVALAALTTALGAGFLYRPGDDVTDGRHDRGDNAAWLSHGWMADDGWLSRNHRDPARYRSPAALSALASRLRRHGVATVFPHLCPAEWARPAPRDAAQTERLLDALDGVRVMPWVGGVFERQVMPDDPTWRRAFARAVGELLRAHPRLAGVNLNVEPWPDGHRGMLSLLEELRAAMPAGRALTVAAYPPPTRWQSDREVHWSSEYTREVARRSGGLAPMMYDTGIVIPAAYEALMARWTREVLSAAAPAPVWLGVPAYDDADKPWHRPWVEDLPHAVRGVHAGLGARPPANYRGLALYAEWEVDEAEWRWLRGHFLRR
ncbi:MAG: hypothetical protein R3A52_01060 [Polyangiales bacterium]